MGSLKAKFRHAFAIDPPGPAEPTPAQQIPVDWLCRQVAKRHLTTPGLIAMEMCRPLNWVIAQGMHLMRPSVWAVTPSAFYEHYKNSAEFIEQRGSIEHLCRRIEQLEQEYEQRRRKTSDDANLCGDSKAENNPGAPGAPGAPGVPGAPGAPGVPGAPGAES